MWWRVQGNPGGPEVGLRTNGGSVAELGAHSGMKTHLQVPVYNVFLVTVVHSRHNLWGRGGKVSYLWPPITSASLRDPVSPCTTQALNPRLPQAETLGPCTPIQS